MAQIWEYIKIALMNIKSNKGRSVLTMLGIIIGIASVILIISIGNGMRSQINGELDSMAGGQVALYTNDSVEGNDVVFTDEDFELVQEKVEHVKGVTPAILSSSLLISLRIPLPMEMIRITEAIPIMIPSMVRMERPLLLLMFIKAIFMYSHICAIVPSFH